MDKLERLEQTFDEDDPKTFAVHLTYDELKFMACLIGRVLSLKEHEFSHVNKFLCPTFYDSLYDECNYLRNILSCVEWLLKEEGGAADEK